jgi:type II secretory pathway component PulM
MPDPTRRRWSRRLSKGWQWLWRDAAPAERIVVLIGVAAILVAAFFAVSAALSSGPCRCGP